VASQRRSAPRGLPCSKISPTHRCASPAKAGWCRFPNPVLDAFRAALRSNHNDAVPLLSVQRLPLVAIPRRRFFPQLWIVARRWRRIAHCYKETLTIMAVVGLIRPENLAECTAATIFCGAPVRLHVISDDVLVWMGARSPVGLRLWKSRDGRKFPKRAVDKKTRPAHIPRTGAPPLLLRLDGAPPKPSLIIRWQSFRPRSAAGGFDAF
jgi:hypothetical protein